VFLGGVSHDSNNASLEAYCSQWGEVADMYTMPGKGYAFVTFASPSQAQAFLEQREHVINGRTVDVKAAVPKDQGNGRLTQKMYVGGITDAIGDDEFRAYFSNFGCIVDATILRTPDGAVRGYGFVTFDDEVSVEKCLVQQHSIAGKLVECKRANPRDNPQQQQQPQQQMQQFYGGGPGMAYGGRGGGPGGGGGRGRGRGGPVMMMAGGSQMMAPGGMMGMPMMGMMGQPGERGKQAVNEFPLFLPLPRHSVLPALLTTSSSLLYLRRRHDDGEPNGHAKHGGHDGWRRDDARRADDDACDADDAWHPNDGGRTDDGHGRRRWRRQPRRPAAIARVGLHRVRQQQLRLAQLLQQVQAAAR
jgi:hypothetical protein